MIKTARSVTFHVSDLEEAAKFYKVLLALEMHKEPCGVKQASLRDLDGNILEKCSQRGRGYFTVSVEEISKEW